MPPSSVAVPNQLDLRGNTEAARVEVTDELHGFDRITDEKIDGVIWNRALPNAIKAALQDLALSESQDCRFSCRISEVSPSLKQALDAIGIGEARARDWLIKDVERLSAKFANILCTEQVRIRTEILCHDGCTKFHQDNIRARMICTYVGPGTVYTAPREDGEFVPTSAVATGCPMLLKGKAWSPPSQPILQHRSPQIEGTGQARLVIVIDTARD